MAELVSFFRPYPLDASLWSRFLDCVTFAEVVPFDLDLRSSNGQNDCYNGSFLEKLVQKLLTANVNVRTLHLGKFLLDESRLDLLLQQPCFRSLVLLDISEVLDLFPTVGVPKEGLVTWLQNLRNIATGLLDIWVPSKKKVSAVPTRMNAGAEGAYDLLYDEITNAGFNCVICDQSNAIVNVTTTTTHAQYVDWFSSNNIPPPFRSRATEPAQFKFRDCQAPYVNMRNFFQTAGSDVVVAVMDTGADGLHPALRDRIIYAKSYVAGSHALIDGSKLDDARGHGSHCAGLVAGYTVGVAPNANLAIYKVLGGGDFWHNLASALNDVLERLDGAGPYIDVISLSAGGWMDQDVHGIQNKINALIARGIVVVCAASNDGKRRRDTVAFPARIPGVLCIGSHDDLGNTSRFSGYGGAVTLTSFGEDVLSLKENYYVHPLIDNEQTGWYTLKSGTSMATPLVAGVVAVMLSHVKQSPDWRNTFTPAFIANLLTQACNNFDETRPEYGHGMLRPERLAPRVHNGVHTIEILQEE